MTDVAKETSEQERKELHIQQSKDKFPASAVRHQNRVLWERVWDREPGQVTAGSNIGSLRLARATIPRKRPWQLEKGKAGLQPLEISAVKRYRRPKTIRVKTVEVKTDEKGKRASTVVIEEGRSLKDMPFRKKALPPKVQAALSI